METSLLSQTPISTPNPTSFREAWGLYKQSRAVFGGRTPEASAFVRAARAAFREEFVQEGKNYHSVRDGWAAESREVGVDGVVVVILHHEVKGWAMTWWQ